MKIIAAGDLEPEKFLIGGAPKAQGSSIDLTIGHIFDDQGNEVQGIFVLKPGEIVQVASAETFSLPANVTGHVTYKTSLTQDGIWALTVGIVDPGWDGPISTTLLNFGVSQYPISAGDAFLRVTLFEHEAVSEGKLRKAKPRATYLNEVKKRAATRFSKTFLNRDAIATSAAEHVMERIQSKALGWIVVVALVFTVAQLAVSFASIKYSTAENVKAQISRDEVQKLEDAVKALNAKIDSLTTAKPSTERTEAPEKERSKPAAK